MCLHPEIKRRLQMTLAAEERTMPNPNYRMRFVTDLVEVNPPIRIPQDVVTEHSPPHHQRPLWYFGREEDVAQLASVRMCLDSYPYRCRIAIQSCGELYERPVITTLVSYEFYIPRDVTRSPIGQWCDHVQYLYMLDYPTLEHYDALIREAQEVQGQEDSEDSSGYSTDGEASIVVEVPAPMQ